MSIITYSVLSFLAFILLYGTFFIVKQQSAASVERFGKFVGVRHSGLQLKIPIIDRVAGRVSLRIQQLDVVIETKTNASPAREKKKNEHAREPNDCVFIGFSNKYLWFYHLPSLTLSCFNLLFLLASPNDLIGTNANQDAKPK